MIHIIHVFVILSAAVTIASGLAAVWFHIVQENSKKCERCCEVAGAAAVVLLFATVFLNLKMP